MAVNSVLVLSDAFSKQVDAEGAKIYPHECCGIMYGRDVTTDGVTRRVVERLQSVDNAFEEGEKYHRFSITPKTLMDAEKRAGDAGQLVIGFYHSHPDHPARPSEYDREHAWPFYSYVIVAITKGAATDTTCWVLNEQTEAFEKQEIVSR
jgi:proteasome lid subunit RPN8/RPN11